MKHLLFTPLERNKKILFPCNGLSSCTICLHASTNDNSIGPCVCVCVCVHACVRVCVEDGSTAGASDQSGGSKLVFCS